MIENLATRLKATRQWDHALRYNIVLGPQVKRAIRVIEAGDRKAAQQEEIRLLNRVWRYANRTDYGAKFREPLESWPILSKADVKADHRAFLVPRVFGVPCATSGSSGVPLALERSLLSIASEQTFIDHLISGCNVSFRQSRVAVLRGNLPARSSSGGKLSSHFRDPRYLVLSTTELNLSNGAAYIDLLKKFKPDILWVYPTAVSKLAEILSDRDTTLRVPVILTSSEVFCDEAWEKVSRSIDGQIVDYYGQAERVCLAFRYARSKWYFHPAYGQVELIPEQIEEPAASGERYARVVATGFWNLRMPLVRYDTSDLIAYPQDYSAEDLREVAAGRRPFNRVLGRDSEYLVTSKGGRVQALNNIAREARGVDQVQFIQHSVDMVEIRVRPNSSFNEGCQTELVSVARTRIPKDMMVFVVSNKPLRQTVNGKTPFVIRDLEYTDRPEV